MAMGCWVSTSAEHSAEVLHKNLTTKLDTEIQQCRIWQLVSDSQHQAQVNVRPNPGTSHSSASVSISVHSQWWWCDKDIIVIKEGVGQMKKMVVYKEKVRTLVHLNRRGLFGSSTLLCPAISADNHGILLNIGPCFCVAWACIHLKG